MKQATILVTERDKAKKKEYANSGLCLICNWELGLFDIPLSMMKAFEEKFNTELVPAAGLNPCPSNITEEDIDRINRNNWPEVFWNMGNKGYIVCINNQFVRDVQIFNPENTPDFDYMNADAAGNWFDEKTEDDDNWNDFSGSIFLGFYKWNENDEDGLRQYVADARGVMAETLEVIPVKM